MPSVTREILLYAIASALAFALDLTVLVLLVETAGVPYLPSAVLGFVAGGFAAYFFCVRLIFRYRRIEDRRIEATTFIGLGVAGLSVNAAGIYAGVEWMGLHYLVAKFGAAGLSFVANYGLRRLALFTPLHVQPNGRQ